MVRLLVSNPIEYMTEETDDNSDARGTHTPLDSDRPFVNAMRRTPL